mmetsp:Transcript_96120/g.272089  ORF Transcript_96120/g.272089 Transcript_96120/m.272089 type:complete len:322 (-) Transcript_96120:18-983(-)
MGFDQREAPSTARAPPSAPNNKRAVPANSARRERRAGVQGRARRPSAAAVADRLLHHPRAELHGRRRHRGRARAGPLGCWEALEGELRHEGLVRVALEGRDVEHGPSGPGLRCELLNDHLLRQWVGIERIQDLEDILAEHGVRNWPPRGVELLPEEVSVLGPHGDQVRVAAVVQHRNLCVELHKFLLLEDTVTVEVVQAEKLLHELLELVAAERVLLVRVEEPRGGRHRARQVSAAEPAAAGPLHRHVRRLERQVVAPVQHGLDAALLAVVYERAHAAKALRVVDLLERLLGVVGQLSAAGIPHLREQRRAGGEGGAGRDC